MWYDPLLILLFLVLEIFGRLKFSPGLIVICFMMFLIVNLIWALLFLLVLGVVCIYLHVSGVILGVVSLFLLSCGFYVYCGVVFRECCVVVDKFSYGLVLLFGCF